DGAQESELKALAGGHPRVKFLPFQNQRAMPAIYRVGDVFILPSRGETWGLALNEAMACSRPIIASDRVGAARDLIQHGVNGWVFEAGNESQLVRLLATVVDLDRGTLKRFSEAARAMSENWSSEAAAARMADIVVSFRNGDLAAMASP